MVRKMCKFFVHFLVMSVTNPQNQEMKLFITCAQHLTAVCFDVIRGLGSKTKFCPVCSELVA